ncbi:MAG: hypothetical protein JST82_12105 [Bacteroidetes bacterium]|nr:hypothetical protein [Bacteroidota bacterium]
MFGHIAGAQIQPPGNGMNPGAKKDSSQFVKSNTSDWKTENVRIYYKQLYSDRVYTPDTSIHTFHRRLINFTDRDLGNSGSPVQHLLFVPEYRLGPTLGYHVYDGYRFDADSLYYYNTSRPYSFFSYQLGGKQEQLAHIMHTQNIKPNWNFAAQYRKINSPGYYNVQRTSHDNASLSTHYQGKKLHYELYSALVYNKEQQDENGGIINMNQIDSVEYRDRRTIRTNFQDETYGNTANTRRSPVTNSLRDYAVILQHSYAFGKTDTVYNEDSTKYSLQLTRRFSITHRAEFSSTRHFFKDVRPDSLRYAPFFSNSFIGGGKDSVYTRQEWNYIDNKILLNTFLGKLEHQMQLSAGLGSRYDHFSTYFLRDKAITNINSTYFTASLNKEALLEKQWSYNIDFISYFAGSASGNTMLRASLGKDISKTIGSVTLSISQHINNAPYNYTTYYNQYDTILHSFNKESVTTLCGIWHNEKYKIDFGARNYLIGNYIYLNADQLPDQYATTINLTQLWLRKVFTWKIIVFDNELYYQTFSSGAPLNIPNIMARHQLGIETNLFKSALKIATGVEVRYHNPYTPAGYSPFFNRFYYQAAYSHYNVPEGSIFFNFKIKRFRAYLMLDQVQQIFYTNTVLGPGYAAQNLMFRFGFNWVLIN